MTKLKISVKFYAQFYLLLLNTWLEKNEHLRFTSKLSGEFATSCRNFNIILRFKDCRFTLVMIEY